MSEGYTVDLGALGDLITKLDSAAKSITAANNALKGTSARDLGSHDLDQAAADFQGRWEFGVGKIADLAGTMVGELEKTKKQYQEVEDRVGSAFPKLESPAGATMSKISQALSDSST